ncbi:MAG: molybdenum cofactor guanylyltransferase [Bryobacteraceae bacterium]|jgi:molybdopterin-guanine dinucleotide biosynthesis protein A
MSIEQYRTNLFPNFREIGIVDGNILNKLSCPAGSKNIAGWVLTGGRSSRMGVDKALIAVEGQPLALRVAAEVAKVCGSVALVGDPDRYRHLGLPVVPDEFPGLGPLAGIEAALRVTESEWNLIVACDMPALNPFIFRDLLAACLVDGAVDGAVPEYADGRLEPLCALYHQRCHPVIRAALDAGVRKVTDSLRSLEIRYVRVASDAPFANLNTPEELRKYTNG